MAKRTDYGAVIEKVFFDGYKKGATEVEFKRQDLHDAAKSLGIVISNIGDALYSFRFRQSLPDKILATQTKGTQWVIEGLGRAKYAFRLLRANRITPNQDLILVKVPDATPELIAAYSLTDEHALLAKVRYNRLVNRRWPHGRVRSGRQARRSRRATRAQALRPRALRHHPATRFGAAIHGGCSVISLIMCLRCVDRFRSRTTQKAFHVQRTFSFPFPFLKGFNLDETATRFRASPKQAHARLV
jgi:hypothetical protein